MKTSYIVQPLKSNFTFSSDCLSRDITLFLEISHGNNNSKMTIKLINILRRNGYHTIEDVVSTDAKRIQLIKRMGDKSFALLLTLLELVSKRR